MEAAGALGGVSVAAAFACGALLAQRAALLLRRRSARPAGGLARAASHGVFWARPAARALLGLRCVADLAGEGAAAVRDRGTEASPEALTSVFVAFVAGAGLAAGLLAQSAAAGVAVAACACALAWSRLRGMQDRRREALREAIPDALRSMGACFQSGFSLLQTFHQVASESADPLRALFQRAANRLETGHGAQEALAELRCGGSSPELAFVAVALDVQHQSGGSMRQVLDAARDTVEGELALRRALRVQTAQAKLSARVVSVMPFVLVAVFSLVSEGFLDPFFESTAGVALLGLALGMQAAGILAVRRMLAVEVG